MEKVTSDDMLNFRALHVNKAKFGSLSVRPFSCSSSVRIFALFYSVIAWHILRVQYGKMAQWWNNNMKYLIFVLVYICTRLSTEKKQVTSMVYKSEALHS